MAVIRGSIPADNFTIVDNRWLRDPELSWKAKGLLSYIASHARGHRLTRDQIIADGADGRDAVVSGLGELEQRGYLKRHPVRGEGGKIVGTDYELTAVDCPVDNREGGGNPSSGKAGPGDDLREHGISAGGATTGFSGAGQPAGKKTTPEKTKEKTTSSAPPRRGTRLPEDFQPDDALRAWYRQRIGNAIDGLLEHEKFMNFWLSKPGRAGEKLDWRRTWQNWMLEALARSGRRPTSGAPAGAASRPRYPTAQERSQAQREEFTARAKAAEEWVERNGGDPNDTKLVLQVMERMKTEESNNGASRTPGMYIDGDVIDAEVIAPREVTAGEGN